MRTSPARPAALAGLGQISFRAGRLDEAIERLEQALRTARQARPRRSRAPSTHSAAPTRRRARQSSRSRCSSRHSTEAQAAGAPIEQLRFAVLLANALIDSGAISSAERSLSERDSHHRRVGRPVAAARLFWTQCRLHTARHEPQLASRYARRALEILERTEHEAYVGMAYHLLAIAEIDAGNEESALELLARGRDLFGSDLTPKDEAKFSIEEARALIALGSNERGGAGRGARARRRRRASVQATAAARTSRSGDVFSAADDRDRAEMLYGQGLDLLTSTERTMRSKPAGGSPTSSSSEATPRAPSPS